jgi:hypothetical protein
LGRETRLVPRPGRHRPRPRPRRPAPTMSCHRGAQGPPRAAEGHRPRPARPPRRLRAGGSAVPG